MLINQRPGAPQEPASPNEVEIERGRLREIRSRLPEAVKPLGKVLPNLVALTVAESSFTSFTFSLALAYNEVEAFTMKEVRRWMDDAERVEDGMTASINTWRNAEQASSVRTL